MDRSIASWFPYSEARRSSEAWGGAPTALSHFDVAFYTLVGKRLESHARAQGGKPYSVLDLGTYFGHSSFCVTRGASLVNLDPLLRVLSIDIFEQPEWLLKNDSRVLGFLEEYGSAGMNAIEKWLDKACRSIGLARNPVMLLKRDVLSLTSADLAALAPEGFKMAMVDCGKTPELMNRIGEYLVDPRVCPPGALIVFQDIFDWHAPFNIYCFWKLLAADVLSLHRAGSSVVPFGEKISEREVAPICDRVGAALVDEETWSIPFTSFENESAALDGFMRLFRAWGYDSFCLRLECLKVGALLRGDRLPEAADLITNLDRRWPARFDDSPLQNSYRRWMHMKSGKKDLSLVLNSPARKARKALLATEFRRISNRLNYLKPVRSERMPQSSLSLRTIQ